MIQHIKLTFLLLFAFTFTSFGQDNLYDCENSKNFAGYLFNTDQFELSRHELERIKFFCELDSTSQLTLLKTYRKLGLFNEEQDYFLVQGIEKTAALSPDFRDEYIRMLMSEQKYAEVQQLIDKGFNFRQVPEHKLGAELLLKNWEKAYQLSQSEIPKTNFKLAGLASVAGKSVQAKRKSPVFAALLSAIIPGAGKAYCGYWGDAAISFMFSASTTFFAVRGFNKYGTESVYPWIIGGIAASYYSANIYGGATSAKRFNNNLDHTFIHETEKILYSDY
jgi:TM2 domain-containing membrane protein YozV